MQASDLAGAAEDVGCTLFCAAPRPEGAVNHPQWRTALRQVEAALGQPGIVAIIGPPGTGKTLLLQAIAQQLRDTGRVPVLLHQGSAPESRRPDVILIDRPDRLPPAVLDALTQHRRPVVLTGRPDMAERLRLTRTRVTVVTLAPLPPADAEVFLAAQLAQANQRPDLLQRDAVARLIQRSGGVPRALQMLAGLSVFMARLGDADQVTVAHVEQAALVQHGTDLEDDDEDGSGEDGSGGDGSDGDAVAGHPTPSEPLPAAPAAELVHRAHRGGTTALALGLLGCAVAGGWALMPRDRPASISGPASEGPLTSPGVPASRDGADAPRPEHGPQQHSVTPSERPAPQATAAPALRPLPPSMPVHINVTYPPGDAAAGLRAAGKLRELGYKVPPPEAGALRGEPAVFYAFAEDEPAASALARALGLGITQVRPAALPRPGAVRVAATPTGAASSQRVITIPPQTGTTR